MPAAGDSAGRLDRPPTAGVGPQADSTGQRPPTGGQPRTRGGGAAYTTRRLATGEPENPPRYPRTGRNTAASGPMPIGHPRRDPCTGQRGEKPASSDRRPEGRTRGPSGLWWLEAGGRGVPYGRGRPQRGRAARPRVPGQAAGVTPPIPPQRGGSGGVRLVGGREKREAAGEKSGRGRSPGRKPGREDGKTRGGERPRQTDRPHGAPAAAPKKAHEGGTNRHEAAAFLLAVLREAGRRRYTRRPEAGKALAAAMGRA